MIELAVASLLAVSPPCRAVALRGDVDGDGRADRVALAPAGSRCRLSVGTVSVTLPPSAISPELPRLVRLAPINEGRGAEIVVSLDSGASTELFGVYTLSGGRLARMRMAGGGPALFPFGGTAAHVYGVDCEGDLVVATTAFAEGRKLSIERRSYRPAGTAFVRAGTTTRRVTAGEFFSFRPAAFGGCA